MILIVIGFFFLIGFDKIFFVFLIVKIIKFFLYGFLIRLKLCFYDILKKLELRIEIEIFFCIKKEMYKIII